MSSFLRPDSLLLIAEDPAYLEKVKESYKGEVLSTAVAKQKYDLAIVKTTKIDNALKMAKSARAVLLPFRLPPSLKAKVERWQKKNKIQVLNADVYTPLLLNTFETKAEVEKGSIAVVTDTAEHVPLLLDFFKHKKLGISFFLFFYSPIGFSEACKLLDQDEETKVVLFDVSSAVLSGIKLKKPAFLLGRTQEGYRSLLMLEDAEIALRVFSAFHVPSKKTVLFLTNDRQLLALPEKPLEKRLEEKLKKLVKKPTSVIGFATVEDFKKVIDETAGEVGVYVIALNAYLPGVDENFVYALAAEAVKGVAIVAYLPGGEKAAKFREKLTAFSIPSFERWSDVEKALKWLGLNY